MRYAGADGTKEQRTEMVRGPVYFQLEMEQKRLSKKLLEDMYNVRFLTPADKSNNVQWLRKHLKRFTGYV